MPPQSPSSPEAKDLRPPSPSPDKGTPSLLWSPPCSCKHCGDRIQALNARVRYLESRVSSLYYLADSLERLYRLVTPERPSERQPTRPGQRPLRTTTTVPPDCVDDIYELARASKDLGDEIDQLWCDDTWDLFGQYSPVLPDPRTDPPPPPLPHTPVSKRKHDDIVRSTFSWEEEGEGLTGDHIRVEKRSRARFDDRSL